MVNILANQCKAREKTNRVTALTWLGEFIVLGAIRLIPYYPVMLGSIIHCISDLELEIRNASVSANTRLMNLVKNTTETFELLPLIHTLTVELLSEHVTTRVASLHWLYMLHEKDAFAMNQFIGDILPALLKTLSDSADEVVLINLQVLAHISLDEIQFQRVLNALLLLFYEDRNLLESRGALIIRKLCSLLDSTNIYLTIAKILTNEIPVSTSSSSSAAKFFDLEFIGLMVQTLNLILLTAPELESLRKSLKLSFQPEAKAIDRSTFVFLYNCWVHNPVSTFSLCLLAQAYHLSARLILKFAETDITVGFLMQIDKLVQLLESPIFIQLRLHLLECNNFSLRNDLLKSLYGLLMLLPQSQAYKTLSDRLATVSSLHMHLGLVGANLNNSNKVLAIDDKQTNIDNLLQQFEDIQKTHVDYRLSTMRGRSLLPSNTSDSSSITSIPPSTS